MSGSDKAAIKKLAAETYDRSELGSEVRSGSRLRIRTKAAAASGPIPKFAVELAARCARTSGSGH
jgi:hypothetical protein